MAVIEFARNVLHMEDADSTEMAAKTQYPVIDLMDSQLNVTEKRDTMSMGAYKCELTEGSKAYEAYGQKRNTGETPPPLRVQQQIPGGF